MSFDHEFPSDRSEWESVTIIDDMGENMTVRISKVGGGTQGRRYPGWWHYQAEGPDGAIIAAGSDLHTGTPKSHHEAAVEVAWFIWDARDAGEVDA